MLFITQIIQFFCFIHEYPSTQIYLEGHCKIQYFKGLLILLEQILMHAVNICKVSRGLCHINAYFYFLHDSKLKDKKQI